MNPTSETTTGKIAGPVSTSMSQTIAVKGMTCGGCENTVETALQNVSGVETATADRTTETVTVEGTADTKTLIAAVEDAGYEAHA